MRGTPEGLPDGFPGKADGHPEWYRMRGFAMAVMAAILEDLGVLVHQEAPALPIWPPHELSAERAEAVDGGADATPEERAAYDAWKRSFEAAAATRSTVGVPSFKFASNEGWIVQPEECRAIATALRACHVDEAFTARVNEMAAAIGVAVRDALIAMGHADPQLDAFSLSRSDLANWLTEWATWNEVAATVGGFTVT